MIRRLLFLSAIFSLYFSQLKAEESVPDTVTTGIYITSIHDIDFREKEYSVNLWLWMKYRNPEFDFTKNLEIPAAKTFTMAYTTTDTLEDGRIYVLMKLQCVMKDSWKIDRFPFDYQVLRLNMENSQFDTTALVFAVDKQGDHFGRFALSGWEVIPDSFSMQAKNQQYKTGFGDESLAKPYTSYSAFKVKIGIQRIAPWTLFWKIFLGMYVAFLIAYAGFYIHSASIEARFGLSVGALFAAVGNKYIIDSSLPDSVSQTLVDTLHGITLFSIFLVVVATIRALRLVHENKPERADKFDRQMARILFSLYLILNIYFVMRADLG